MCESFQLCLFMLARSLAMASPRPHPHSEKPSAHHLVVKPRQHDSSDSSPCQLARVRAVSVVAFGAMLHRETGHCEHRRSGDIGLIQLWRCTPLLTSPSQMRQLLPRRKPHGCVKRKLLCIRPQAKGLLRTHRPPQHLDLGLWGASKARKTTAPQNMKYNRGCKLSMGSNLLLGWLRAPRRAR